MAKTYTSYISSCSAGSGTIYGASNPVGVPYTNSTYAYYNLESGAGDNGLGEGSGTISCSIGKVYPPSGAIIGSANIKIRVRAGMGTQKLMLATSGGGNYWSKMNNITGSSITTLDIDLSELTLDQINGLGFSMYNGGSNLSGDSEARLYGATLTVTLLGEDTTAEESLAPFNGTVIIEGVNKALKEGFANVGGVLKSFTSAYVNIGGSWKLASGSYKWKKYTNSSNTPGTYKETVYGVSKGDYPFYGVKGGYFYVFDGNITFNKYSVSYTMTEGSEGSFSGSDSSFYPMVLTSSVSVDAYGTLTCGDAYTASSASNLRSNYSTYPYTSFTSETPTLNPLYKITAASIFSYKRKLITFTREVTYIGDVTGTLELYPYHGIHTDGYYYAPVE